MDGSDHRPCNLVVPDSICKVLFPKINNYPGKKKKKKKVVWMDLQKIRHGHDGPVLRKIICCTGSASTQFLP